MYTGLPLPTNFTIPSDGNNYGAAIAFPDNNTIFQTQPICKCNSSTPYTTEVNCALEFLNGMGAWGAHGGSGLSAIGGTIRLGELLPGAVIRHVLKMNLDANKHCYKNPCFRYPAIDCDGYHLQVYNGTIEAVRPGALLALPASLNITSLGLETVPGASIAWTLQNYGAYVVDDTYYWDIFVLCGEMSVKGNIVDEFLQTYGYSTRSTSNGWARDLNKIYNALHVVDNWNWDLGQIVQASNGAMGSGGGAPRQPWAPALPGIPPDAPPKIPLATKTLWNNGTIASGWSMYSAGTLSISSSQLYYGSKSQKLVTTNSWQNYQFSSAGFNTSGWYYLHFAMMSGGSAQVEGTCVQVQLYAGPWTSAILVGNVIKYGGSWPISTAWTVYNIPLFSINASNSIIQTILIEDCTGTGGNTFYLDQVQFTTIPYTNGTGTPSTTTVRPIIIS